MTRKVVASAVLLLALVAACSRPAGKREKAVTEQVKTARKIAEMERDIDTRRAKLNALLSRYVASGGKELGALVGSELTPEQTRLLEEKLKKEEGVGYRDLITDILSKQRAVEDLKMKVQALELTLPAPVEVKSHQTHYGIAMAFLTHEIGLAPEKAATLIMKVNVDDELLPGFKVWNFYDGTVYGTFVTQGSAPVSPYVLSRNVKMGLMNERDAAVAKGKALDARNRLLMSQVSDLEAKRDRLSQDVSLLTEERSSLTRRVNQLVERSRDLDERLNSVFYAIGPQKALVRKGAVRRPLYGSPVLAKYDSAAFPNHFDLRSGDAITFTAEEAGVKTIHAVEVAPGNLYQANRDYAVSISPDGARAKLWILRKQMFLTGGSMVVLVR